MNWILLQNTMLQNDIWCTTEKRNSPICGLCVAYMYHPDISIIGASLGFETVGAEF